MMTKSWFMMKKDKAVTEPTREQKQASTMRGRALFSQMDCR